MSYLSLFNSTVSNNNQFSFGAVGGYFLTSADEFGNFKWVPLGDFAVTEILGTTNRINVSDDGKGTYTISTPQDTATTSSPTFYALKLTNGAGSGKILSSDASGNTSWITPSYVSSIAGTANRIIVTDDGKGNYTISAPQDINTTSSPTFNTVTANLSGNLTATNTISRNIIPDGNNTRNLGDPLTYYNTAYIQNLEGNAYSATYVIGASQALITTLANLATAGKFTLLTTNPTIGANLLSLTNNTYDIGTSGNVFRNIYATTFNGALNGNASTATTATSATTAATVTNAAQAAITTLANISSLNGVSVSSTLWNYLTSITPGTASASKALILDSSKNIAGIGQISTDYILIGTAGTSITPNIVFAAAAADSGLYATSSNQIGISISKASKLLAKSTGVDIVGTLALTGSQTISSDLTVSGTLTTGSFTVTTLNATMGNITTLNSTTINNSGTGNITTVNADNYRTQSTSTSLSTSSKHQFNQSVSANDNNASNYLPYFEVSPVTTILGNTQNVIGLYNQSRFNPASGVTLARGYGEFIGLIHNGVGTTTDLSSIYIANMYKASGNVTNNVALRIEEQTYGTNNFAMYSAGLHQFFRTASNTDTVIINNSSGSSPTRLLNMYASGATANPYITMGRSSATVDAEIAIAGGAGNWFAGAAQGDLCIRGGSNNRIQLGCNGAANGVLQISKSGGSFYPVLIDGFLNINVTNFAYLNGAATVGYFAGTQANNISLYVSHSILVGGQFMSISDIRKKQDIRDITDEEVNKFLSIKPRNYKKDGAYQFGFVAQDFVKEDLKHVVRLTPEEGLPEHIDEEGNVSPANVLLTINDQSIIGLLHATIRKQQTEINTLKSQLNSVLEILARNNIV